VPAGQRACPRCGGERQCIEPHVTEVIELLPPEVIVRRDIREELTCVACDGEPVRAPAGETVVPNGKLGLGLVASILVEKYLDGLPLHRQRDRYRRLGLDIAVSTLADQVKWCTDLLQPVWRALLAGIIDARVMHLDGTSLPVQDSEAAGGKRIGALWGYVGVNAGEVMAAYLYVSSRIGITATLRAFARGGGSSPLPRGAVAARAAAAPLSRDRPAGGHGLGAVPARPSGRAALVPAADPPSVRPWCRPAPAVAGARSRASGSRSPACRMCGPS
jgi:transposase